VIVVVFECGSGVWWRWSALVMEVWERRQGFFTWESDKKRNIRNFRGASSKKWVH